MPLNFTKTALLLAAMTLIFVSMGAVVGGETGLIIAFVLALATNAFALWKSDTMVLRLQGAEEVTAATQPHYYAIVAGLAERAQLPMPRVYLIRAPQPNAFATGRSPSSAAICATEGLLNLLQPNEVAGVLAHELAHVKNRDTLTMTVAATIGGAISMLAQWLQVSFIFGGSRGNRGRLATFAAMLLAPLAAMIVQMAISRSREYQADRLGAEISGDPLALASALQKIQTAVRGIPNATVQHIPALAPLFIINPLTGGTFDNLFSTHPSTENRIAALVKLAEEMRDAQARRGENTVDWRNTTPPKRETDRGPWGRRA